MVRHDSTPTPTGRRALIALATAGAALGAGAGTAAAAAEPVLDGARTRPASLGHVAPQGPTGAVGHVTGPVSRLRPNPLAGTGVDPLDNGVGTQIADFRPLTSKDLTGPVAQAESVGAIPVVGPAAGSLGG
ncbi:hypothetical protein [Streptomyces aurantiogriseus]|uniref:ATP-binding protein n=1 Tax=Streptomyces aurantiogriseus TaxID=66870 RepID=A0A918F3K5_9ACTN|nr:hypothetical protein [Streptomyces aurantiogriseus]GGR01398.1 hypothetical protein GCM10010251_16230 [Streptomyces aurantiogriseus]